ncbi:MAG: 50S ribosomal protein L11 methyltransferase [Tagaea sp.]
MANLWRLTLFGDAISQAGYVQAFEEEVGAITAFETSPNGPWRIEAFFETKPDLGRLAPLVFAVAKELGRGVPSLEIEEIAERDWLAENQASFPPLRIGRFFVHGSHVREKPPADAWTVALDASIAFGSGEHATTKGCLAAIEALAKKRRRLGRALDIGTGSGILTIASLRAGARRALASDIDPPSVTLARENMRANGVASRANVRHAAGLAKLGATRGRFDLVLANILARPLTQLATAISRAVAPGGYVVLSGLLAEQENWVLRSYRQRGLVFVGRASAGPDALGWRTLVLRRKPAA